MSLDESLREKNWSCSCDWQSTSMWMKAWYPTLVIMASNNLSEEHQWDLVSSHGVWMPQMDILLLSTSIKVQVAWGICIMRRSMTKQEQQSCHCWTRSLTMCPFQFICSLITLITFSHMPTSNNCLEGEKDHGDKYNEARSHCRNVPFDFHDRNEED